MGAVVKAKTLAESATTVTEDSTPIYDGKTDVWRGVNEAYQTIRERIRRGGPGWTAGGDGATDHKIFIRRDGAHEEWLTVHPNGRLEHHVEGHAFLWRGPQARDRGSISTMSRTIGRTWCRRWELRWRNCDRTKVNEPPPCPSRTRITKWRNRSLRPSRERQYD
jgi:hypothetical protein